MSDGIWVLGLGMRPGRRLAQQNIFLPAVVFAFVGAMLEAGIAVLLTWYGLESFELIAVLVLVGLMVMAAGPIVYVRYGRSGERRPRREL